jgi:hypothetical protein
MPIIKSKSINLASDHNASIIGGSLKAVVAQVYGFLIGVLCAVPSIAEGSRLDVLMLPLGIVLGVLAGALPLSLLVLLLKFLTQGLLDISSYLLVAAAYDNEIIKISAHLTT